jgi:PiT family inorganic phosphate transporter
MESDLILVIVIATALAFDFTNGFHDTANVVATSISTRAMSPRLAVTFAAILNFVGAFISLKVAATVAKGIVDPDKIMGGQGMTIVFAGLIGAIAWNLATWWFGLPSSSSHALIGGVVGSTFAAVGSGAIDGNGLLAKVAIPALIAPLLAFTVAGFAILVIYRIVGRVRPGPVTRGFKLGQLASGGLLALAHGTNDAQKTMGIITLALIAHGRLGDRQRRHGDRARDLRRRLADHPDDGQPDHQDGRRAGLLGAERRLGGDPRGVALRLSALDDPRDQRRDHGRRRG